MASTSSRIRIIFDGATQGIRRAARQAENELNRLDRALNRHKDGLDAITRGSDRLGSATATMLGGFAKLGAAASGIQAFAVVGATTVSVLSQLAPIALTIPAILLGIGVAYGTAKLALAGFSDAVKGDAEALAKFGPAGQAAVKAVQGLEAGFTKMRKAVSEAFFQGLSTQIQATGKELLSLGTDSLPRVASGLGGMATELLKMMRGPFFTGDVADIVGNTGTALGNMRMSLANVVSGFVGLGAAGSRYLPALGKAIDDVAARFRKWVDSGIESGRIQQMIDDAIRGFRDLGTAMSAAFRAGESAMRAFNLGMGGSGGTIESIKNAALALEQFVARPEIQQGLTALGTTVAVVGEQFRSVLGAALRELGPILSALQPFIQELATQIGTFLVSAIETVGPLLLDLAKWLSQHKEIAAALGPALVILAAGFKALSLAISAVRGITTLVSGFKALSAAVRGINPAVLTRIALAMRRFIFPALAFAGVVELAQGLDKLNLAAADGDPTKLDTMGRTLHNLVGAFDLLMQAIGGNTGPLVDSFVDDMNRIRDSLTKEVAGTSGNEGQVQGSVPRAVGNIIRTLGMQTLEFKIATDNFAAEVQAFPDKIKLKGGQLDNWAKVNIVDPIVNSFNALGPAISTKISEIGTWIGNGFEQLRASVESKLMTIRDAINNFFTYDTGFAIGAWIGTMISVVGAGFANLGTTISTKLGELGTIISTFFTVTVPAALTSFGTTLSTAASAGWEAFKTASVTKGNEIVAWVGALPALIGGALSALPGVLTGIVTNAWNSFFGGTQQGGQKSVSEAGTVPGKTGGVLGGLLGILRERATAAWNSFLTTQAARIVAIINDVRALPGKITSALGNMGSLLVNAGRAVMDGFLSGIKSGYNSVISFVSGIAAGVAANKGPLPYDRIVLIPNGLALMDGLLAGVRKGYGQVEDYVSGMASDLARTVSVQAAYDLTGPSGQTAAAMATDRLARSVAALAAKAEQDAVPPAVRVFIGDRELTDMITTEIDESTRRTARVVGAGRR